MLKYAAALVLVFGASPVFAQAPAQDPPAPNSAHSEPQSANSMPPGAANMNLNSVANPNLAGSSIGGITTNSTNPRPTVGTTRP